MYREGETDLGKVISITNLKGGVGKTILTYSIGCILAESGVPRKKGRNKSVKVLLIDMDMQENLTSNVGIVPVPGMLTTYDIFEKYVSSHAANADPNDIVIRSPIEELPNLDLLPGSMNLHRVDTMIASEPARESILLNYMTEFKDFFDQYDYIFVDSNPSMSMINQNCYLASDEIILVAGTSNSSIDGIELFQALWGVIRRKLGIKPGGKGEIVGVIINNYDTRTAISRDFIEHIDNNKEEIAALRYKTIIPANVRLAESELDKPINLYDKTAKSYLALLELIKEMSERGVFNG